MLFDPLFPKDLFDELLYYDVEVMGGRIGIIEHWQRDGENRATKFVVAQGLLGHRRVALAVNAIAEIDHDRKRIVLHPSAVCLANSRFGRRKRAKSCEPEGPQDLTRRL
jgi:hypothetical protein